MRGMASSLLGVVLLASLLAACQPAPSLPSGFIESNVITGLELPTQAEFARDGRVFVAEKSGIIKVYSSPEDPTPTIFADLRTEVHNYWDRGLLAIELHPDFPTSPWLYALYTRDAPLGRTPPFYGFVGADDDPCPGYFESGCVASGELVRLRVDGEVAGAEQVLMTGWCQQYLSHSMGDIAFGRDGALYVSAGEGASFTFADWGQGGNSVNPCGDPPGGQGGEQAPPTAEGGSLRAQDLRLGTDPVGTGGTIVRLDPETGAALGTNPLAGSADANARRIIAYGLRNPFRLAFRPRSNELFVADPGSSRFEEINRIPSTTDRVVENFGWPCYEGDGRQPVFESSGLDACRSLYETPGSVSPPFAKYSTTSTVTAGEPCPTGGAAVTGLTFYPGGPFPDRYDGALFFADYARQCIWVMTRGSDGRPDPASVQTFHTAAAGPTQLEVDPRGDLYFVDVAGGIIRRISYETNRRPVARISASPMSGASPLSVTFDSAGSSDPEGTAIGFAWDLDGDGAYDDSTAARPQRTYGAGVHRVALQVTDAGGALSSASATITVDNDAPTPAIDSPTTSLRWAVGDRITFSGRAPDRQQGDLPASSMRWSLVMNHCGDGGLCHAHPIRSFEGVTSGEFVAPDHEYPSYLSLELTATDATGLVGRTSVRIDPRTVTLNLRSTVDGADITVGEGVVKAPASVQVIANGRISVGAVEAFHTTYSSPRYEFISWSDGRARGHVVAMPTDTTLTATYRAAP